MTDWIPLGISGEDRLERKLGMMTVSLTSWLSDFGDPAVILNDSCSPDISRNLWECGWWRSEEHPEVNIVLDVVWLGHF